MIIGGETAPETDGALRIEIMTVITVEGVEAAIGITEGEMIPATGSEDGQTILLT